MKKKNILVITIGIFMLIVSFMIIANRKLNNIPTEDEIQLQIKLELKEDIGLLILDYSIDGIKGSRGISNANHSLLKRDELLYYSFVRNKAAPIKEEVSVTIKFRIITKYIDPNYENVYPEKYTKTMNEISFNAQYGQSYSIIITGDKTNGYKAEFNQ